VVPAIVGREQSFRVFRITDDRIEVDDPVEIRRRTDPCVHSLAIEFVGWPRVIVARSRIRSYRRSINAESMRMRARDHLLIGSNDSLDERGMSRGWHLAGTSESAKIVHAFKDDDPSNSSRRE